MGRESTKLLIFAHIANMADKIEKTRLRKCSKPENHLYTNRNQLALRYLETLGTVSGGNEKLPVESENIIEQSDNKE